jgi:hypothetical protein
MIPEVQPESMSLERINTDLLHSQVPEFDGTTSFLAETWPIAGTSTVSNNS